jgi:hypothetical protein
MHWLDLMRLPRSAAACVALLATLGLAACDSSTGPGSGRTPVALAVVAGDAQVDSAGALLPQPVVVRVLDEAGQPVRGATVGFSVAAGGGSVDPASAVSDADGRAQTRWTLGSSGPQQLQAVVNRGRLSPLLATASATLGPGAVTSLSATGGTAQSGDPGQRLTDSLTVTVYGRGGPMAGVVVQWTTDPGSGSVSPGQSVTNASGVARTAWTLGSANGEQHAYATVSGYPTQPFTATAGPIAVTMQSPYPGSTAGDTAVFYVPIQSRFQLQSVVAEVEGRSVALAFTGSAWTGKLSLVGLAQGPKTTTLTVRDLAGNVAVNHYAFTYDRAPLLTVTSPQANDAVLGSGRVQAICSDDFSGPCTVAVYFPAGGPQQSARVLVASGTGGVDQTLPRPGDAGTLSWVEVEAVDALGAKVTRRFVLFVEDALPPLSIVATGGTMMLDIDATRVLYADSGAAGVALKVRNRAGGAEQTVLPAGTAGQTLYDAGLTAYGVAYTVAENKLYDWRGGTASLVTSTNPRCQFEPQFVACLGIVHYALASGVVTGLGGLTPDLAENGDVVYEGNGDAVLRFRGGVITTMAAHGHHPRSDGNQVLFWDFPSATVRRADPGGAEVLSTTQSFDFDAENGWLAWPVPISTPGGQQQIWTRSPANVVRQATILSTGVYLQSLGPSGQVEFTPQAQPPLFLAVAPYTSPLAVGHLISFATPWQQLRIRWVGDELYHLIGRAAVRVSY